MNRVFMSAVMAIIILTASAALALDQKALTGKWILIERAQDNAGNPCPFVGQQIEFTADGKMMSPNMPMPFSYKVNPAKAEVEAAISRNPELKGMEIMLASVGGGIIDWTKARIVYGVKLSDNQFTMKVSGYTPARYKKLK